MFIYTYLFIYYLKCTQKRLYLHYQIKLIQRNED
uniref:Uncharacterized protein n=1 Tax=Siphoviridae sp. ct47y1 TaxID=2827775 RepID=A0A8S5T8Z1_9CAUD|nr:MAG TPA: hypothetical protein [Siphoviridae sp. ct47y1]